MDASFIDRFDAGQQLAQRLMQYADRPEVEILALPRGGVPVAFEVSQALYAPLDVFVVRKLGLPGHEELAMGAIASGGVRVLNQDVIQSAGVAQDQIELVARREQKELERREHLYRGDRPRTRIHGRTIILVDDGLATGSTMLAAVQAVRAHEPQRIIVAVPVASREAIALLEGSADELVSVLIPPEFMAVGAWYEQFDQTTDSEVRLLLERATAHGCCGSAHSNAITH